jgi:hypothetical protein
VSKIKLISTEIKEAMKELDLKKKEISTLESKVGKDVVGVLKKFIRENDLLDSVRWAQYTPHFNDGDVCEFGVNDLEFKFSKEVNDLLNIEEYVDGDEENNWVGDWKVDSLIEDKVDVLNHKEVKKIEDAIKQARSAHEVLRDISGFLQAEFGDHTQVTVSKKGIETDGYEHD